VQAYWAGDGGPRSEWARADAEGRFSVRVPATADVRLFARAGPRSGTAGPARLGGDEVAVPLVEGRAIEGRVALPAPDPLSVLLVATDAGGRTAFGSCDGEGRFRLEGLPEGRWSVSALVVAGGPWSGTVPDVPSGAAGVEVRLSPAAE
jgi:hypothetical protein